MNESNRPGAQPVLPGSAKSTPVITWIQPAPITNPAPLTSEQLDATANVSGMFTYSPAAGTVLSAGTQTLTATFAPSDTTDYNSETASVTIVVVNGASAPGAFVYVETNSNIEGGNSSIPSSTYGYSVAENGQLTPIAGFPLPYDFGGVVSGKYLFAGDADGEHLDTYLIGADGAFSKIQSVLDKATAQCGSSCRVSPYLTDRNGAALYVQTAETSGGDVFNNSETYSIDQSTGALSFLSNNGGSESGMHQGNQLDTFSGNDLYGYGLYSSAYGPDWVEFVVRNSDGSLASAPDAQVNGPTPPPGIIYSQVFVQADSGNHLAAELMSYDEASLGPLNSLPILLVSYTINPDGSLTTTNTTADMPTVDPWSTASLSPSGTLLAVGGERGIQIFNFNGAAPLTPNTGLIPTDLIVALMWDAHNHLYALSNPYTPNSMQRLYIFTVTSTSTAQAPGSPYDVPNAQSLYVASN